MRIHPFILFDLDGTLIDHFAVIARCYRHALSSLGCEVPSPEVIRRSVGGSMEVTMRGFVDAERVTEAARLWREHFEAIFLEELTLLPGALELVSVLHRRGCRLGVLTNKIGDHSRAICRHLGLDPFLDLVLGAKDTPYRKPQPEFSRLALEKLGAHPDEAVLIGDSPFDVDAARAGGFPCLGVTTGTHTAEELRAAGCSGIFDGLPALAREAYGIELALAPAAPRP